MKKLILTAALILAPGLALAEDTTCAWKKAENGNFLVRTGDCYDGLTGGYYVSSVKIEIENGIKRTTTTFNGRPAEGPRKTVEERKIASAD